MLIEKQLNMAQMSGQHSDNIDTHTHTHTNLPIISVSIVIT